MKKIAIIVLLVLVFVSAAPVFSQSMVGYSSFGMPAWMANPSTHPRVAEIKSRTFGYVRSGTDMLYTRFATFLLSVDLTNLDEEAKAVNALARQFGQLREADQIDWNKIGYEKIAYYRPMEGNVKDAWALVVYYEFAVEPRAEEQTQEEQE